VTTGSFTATAMPCAILSFNWIKASWIVKPLIEDSSIPLIIPMRLNWM
jgi:hypothetical protein